MTTKRVIVWSAPRCVSTAFERSLMNLDNSEVLHEPYSIPYYFGTERESSRYCDVQPDPKATVQSVSARLQKHYDGKNLVIAKDMAYYVDKHHEMFINEGFKDFRHAFLIRNPEKAVYSLYKASTDPQLTGWNYFDPTEAGFVQLFSLYQFVREHIESSPIVIDADDLLDSPDDVMVAFCEALGIAHKEGMTKWEPGPVQGWETWSGWHENVLKSSGFARRDADLNGTAKESPCAGQEIPRDVQTTIARSMPGYMTMFGNRTKPVKPVRHVKPETPVKPAIIG